MLLTILNKSLQEEEKQMHFLLTIVLLYTLYFKTENNVGDPQEYYK